MFWEIDLCLSLLGHRTIFISDLMNSNGKFLTIEEFQNKFEIKANYLHYFQLIIAAIPPDFERKTLDLVPQFLICSEQLQSSVRWKIEQ